MIKLNDRKRINLSKLCSCRKDDIMLLWFLEGTHYCAAWVDDVEHPEEAIIIAADFCYLLGTVRHIKEIEQIIVENARNKVIIPCGIQWVAYLNEYLSSKVCCYSRYAMKHECNVLDIGSLNNIINKIDCAYKIRRIDQDIYDKVLGMDWAFDGCCFFRSYEDFNKNGLGYAAFKDRQLVCIASSYVACKNIVEVTIGTLEQHRRNGLAAACAAALILECLERGIYPRWEAANMDSVALAEKLGYHFVNAFDVYSII